MQYRYNLRDAADPADAAASAAAGSSARAAATYAERWGGTPQPALLG